MKKQFAALCIFSMVLALNAAEKAAKSPLFLSDTIIWAGLDFSKARMIGPGQFTDGAAIFPGMLEAWNDLFLRERLPSVERETKKRVLPDIGGVTEVNKTASAKQIIASPGPDDTVQITHITEQDIAKAVKGYKLESKSGLATVFIVDRFVKLTKKGEGALYVVVFDAGTREILFKQREIHDGTGFGFRNYWFRVVKDSERALGKIK